MSGKYDDVLREMPRDKHELFLNVSGETAVPVENYEPGAIKFKAYEVRINLFDDKEMDNLFCSALQLWLNTAQFSKKIISIVKDNVLMMRVWVMEELFVENICKAAEVIKKKIIEKFPQASLLELKQKNTQTLPLGDVKVCDNCGEVCRKTDNICVNCFNILSEKSDKLNIN